MILCLFIITFFLSSFATIVMSYISIATPIGPWIAPTLVLLALMLCKLCVQKSLFFEDVASVTVASSISGIVATAVGFALPTLYFLDQELFVSWISSPVFFCTVLFFLVGSFGWLGLWMASICENKMLVRENRSFPIGPLVYKMIVAHNQVKKASDLLIGFLGTMFFCVLQDGLWGFLGVIPKRLILPRPTYWFREFFPPICIDLWPMLWAIGFVTGHVIAIPLLVGSLSKLFIVTPLNILFFVKLPWEAFVLSFCGGLVLSGAIWRVVKLPRQVFYRARFNLPGTWLLSIRSSIGASAWVELLVILTIIILFLSYFKFSFLLQLCFILSTILCTYQIITIAGDIGLAQLGRFATFVTIPALFMFQVDFEQLVIMATGVQVCGGVAVDIMFGKKIAYCGNFSQTRIRRYQYLGLFISALLIGSVFWLLVNNFQLGSAELFAQRAQARALLISIKSFNYYVLSLGCFYGFLLKALRVNPTLVLGGLLMPLNVSVGLILGSLGSLMVEDKEKYYPFWSGVFAANSVWMLLQTIL